MEGGEVTFHVSVRGRSGWRKDMGVWHEVMEIRRLWFVTEMLGFACFLACHVVFCKFLPRC